MFNNIMNDFDSQMIRNRLIKSNIENSLSYWSDDENNDEFEQEHYPYYALNGIKTRIVWITNYTNNANFPINVPADDPLLHIASTSSSTTELESVLSNEKNDMSLLSKIHTLDLSKLNLDDLLLLLHRLQQYTTKNAIIASTSAISSSSSSSSSGFIERQPSFRIPSQIPTLHSFSPTLSNTIHSSLSMLDEIPSNSNSINRRQSSFTLSNIADVPKQLTTTLAKPISSLHSQTTKHIHSPNDVANKLLQSFHLQTNKAPEKCIKHKPQRYSPSYTYRESQQHKAKLISNLLSSNSIGHFPYLVHQNNFYH